MPPFSLAGGFKAFNVSTGLEPGTGELTAEMEIYRDNVRIFYQAFSRSTSPAAHVSLDVTNGDRLRLAVSFGGDCRGGLNYGDGVKAIWGDAVLS
jgi:hypothetical protein